MMNDSLLSDLKNELFNAKNLQGDEKEELLVSIQVKLDELVNATRPQYEYMQKFQEAILENQRLSIQLNHTECTIKDQGTKIQ